MKPITKIFLASLLCSTLVGSGCSESSEQYSELFTYMRTDIHPRNLEKINYQFNSDTIIGDGLVKVPIRITRPISSDVNYTTEVSEELLSAFNSSNSTSKTLLPSDMYTLSTQGKIAAGSTTDTLFIQLNREKITQTAETEAKEYLLPIQLTSTNHGEVSRLYSTYYVDIHAKYSNLQLGVPANSQFISNRDTWVITIQEGVEGVAQNLIDNKVRPDVAKDREPFWITFDLGEEKTITGIRTNSWWGGNYYPLEIELFISDDGNSWRSIGSIETPSVTTYYRQEISFISPVTTQYLKYQIIKIASSGRTSLVEFNIYEPISQ